MIETLTWRLMNLQEAAAAAGGAVAGAEANDGEDIVAAASHAARDAVTFPKARKVPADAFETFAQLLRTVVLPPLGSLCSCPSIQAQYNNPAYL